MKKVVVVGGGIAGSWAAVTAANEGAQVTLVSRAPGATALYAGGMEIVPDLDMSSSRDPHHPFRRLGMDQVGVAAALDDACAAFQTAIARAGLPIEGNWRESRNYADIHGGARPAALVPATVSPGELTGLLGLRVGVAGIDGLAEYDVAGTVAVLREESGIDAFPIPMQLDGLPVSPSLTDLFGLPAPVPQDVRAEAIAYPPGFTHLPENGFELLCSPPSPHGWRLQQALLAALRAAGVDARRGSAIGFRSQGDRLTAVELAGGAQVEGDAFVLATGRFIGGGLVKSRQVTEPLLDLGVFYEGEPLAREYGRRVRHLEFLGPAPAFRVGLMTDERLRPFDRHGNVAFRNLLAAGSVLGGYDYGAGYGFGVPLLTGALAGRDAAA